MHSSVAVHSKRKVDGWADSMKHAPRPADEAAPKHTKASINDLRTVGSLLVHDLGLFFARRVVDLLDERVGQVLHLLEAAVLTPKIVGHKVGLSESAALFAVVAGGKLLGFVGILLAVPIAATIAVLLRHAVRYYEKSGFFGVEDDALVNVSPAMALVMTDDKAPGTRSPPPDPEKK